MKSRSDVALEQQWLALVQVFEKYTAVPSARPSFARFEAVLDALYQVAGALRSKGLRQLESFLAERLESLPPVRIWIALTRLHRVPRHADLSSALENLQTYLETASRRTQWIVVTNAASSVWQRLGPEAARRWMADITPFPGEEAWQFDSGLIIAGTTTTISLALACGDRAGCNRMVEMARTWWPETHPARCWVELLLIEQLIAQGDFMPALKQLRSLEAAANGEVRPYWLCARLHALVGAGRAESRTVRTTYRELLESMRTPPGPDAKLPLDERRRLRERAGQIARSAGLKKTPAASASSLAGLLSLEKDARIIKNPQRRQTALVRVIERAEALLLAPRPDTEPDEDIRTKLLWCRLIVELHYVEMAESCEDVLEDVMQAAQRLGYTQLHMLALDQRAVLRAQSSPPNWKGAIADSTQAASLALELLSRNAAAKPGKGAERSFLASLLPILDRVIDLHVQGALRLGQRHAVLLDEPIGELNKLLRIDSQQGTFLRFGRVIHTFVEQSQALALAAARNAFAGGPSSPRSFVVALDGEARIVVDSYRANLRPDTAILQYFVFGRYVLQFVYGRDFFDWHLSSIVESAFLARPEPAHRKIEDLLRLLRPWMQGELHETDLAALNELQRLIWPPKVDSVLRKYKIQHLCIVPHDNLYRIPFGRLETPRGTLLQCYSTSIHPTGQLASSGAINPVARAGRRVRQAFISGPKIDCIAQEREALVRAHGHGPLHSVVESFDGSTIPLRTIISRLSEFHWVHFLCHGEEGGSFARSPALHVGPGKTDRLELSHMAQMQLAHCGLVVLQSCWTGWLDHRRTNPVQGFPQAFCDAGAHAVIAPLTKVPQPLAPIFTETLYRALRFLPAEQALQRSLSLLRRFGPELVRNHPEAQEALREHGGMDAFEYRYVGKTGLVSGHWSNRWLGRLSFWWWERGLRRLHQKFESASKHRRMY